MEYTSIKLNFDLSGLVSRLRILMQDHLRFNVFEEELSGVKRRRGNGLWLILRAEDTFLCVAKFCGMWNGGARERREVNTNPSRST